MRHVTCVILAALAISRPAAGQQPAPPAPPPSPVIARIEGRPVTQEDFDRYARPYFEQLRAQLKEAFAGDIVKMANRNVLDEIFRRELLVIEAQRAKLPITEADTDRILRNDPYFLTNGVFDQAKFIQYKVSPGSNYLNVLPQIREAAAAGKMDSIVRARCAPSAAAVRAEWLKRNDRVRFELFPLGLRDVSLEPEADEAEWEAYYEAHPEEFEVKARARFRYLRLPVPAPDDSLRASGAAAAMWRGRRIVDSLRAGAPLDTLAAGSVLDTGPFELPAAALPGLGADAELLAAVARVHADADTASEAAIGPVLAGDAVVVGVLADRQPRKVPPLREVLAEVRRRADAEKRERILESERRAHYEAHRDTYRSPRGTLTRMTIVESTIAVKPPRAKDVERWHERNVDASAGPDGGAVPPLDDSLRAVVAERLVGEERAKRAARALARAASRWRPGGDPGPLARSAGARAETLTFARGTADSVFPAAFLDSLLGMGAAGAGEVEGPRSFSGYTAVWRVEGVDTAHVPPLESVRERVERERGERKRLEEEEEARRFFEARRDTYKTKPKFVIDYAVVRIPPPDSVDLPESRVRAHYDAHLQDYRQEEQVRARHILLRADPGDAAALARTRSRADSLREALVAGADFADLARRFSDDPGSAAAGGDLGAFPRGRMVPEFSDTAFALEPGGLSQPVKTSFGYHLIRVEEKTPASVRSFEEVRGDLRARLARSEGDSLALRSATDLARRLAGGRGATDTAGIATSPPFALNEPVPGLGFVQGLAQDLEALPAGRWASKAYRAGNSYAVVRPGRRVPPGPADFEEVRAQVIEEMKTEKKKEILVARVAAIREFLAAGASLDSAAAPYGGLKDSGLQHRSAVFVPFVGREPRIVSRAFDMKVGAVSDTLATAQGVAWIRVEERTTAEGAAFAKDRDAITQEIATRNYNEWIEQRKKTVTIEILRHDLREAPPPRTVTITPGGP